MRICQNKLLSMNNQSLKFKIKLQIFKLKLIKKIMSFFKINKIFKILIIKIKNLLILINNLIIKIRIYRMQNKLIKKYRYK